MSTLKKKYTNVIRKALIEKKLYKNVMQVPKLTKIVINRGLGESSSNSKAIEISLESLYAISGQKPITTKVREGQIIGCKVTLRSDRMYDFLTKFTSVCLPRIRDFRGLPVTGFDGRGNYTLGIKEELIFPEIAPEKMDKIRGFDISFVTTAETDFEAYELLKEFGMLFRSELKKK
jgi:large subunit ribosomal protein L5